MAVTDMGLSPNEFWELTWYDWSLYLMRYVKRMEREKFEREYKWAHTREILAMLANIAPGRDKSSKTWKGIDFMRFDWDKVEAEERDPELFRKMKGQLGSKIKKDAIG